MTDVIDKYYPCEKTSEDHIYMESGNKKGSVVIKINES